MITIICSDILGALSGITGVKNVDAWAGDVEALLKTPQKIPGLYLVYPGARFNPGPVTMGTVHVDTTMDFHILLVVNNLASPKGAAAIAWGIIEGVRTNLIGRQVSTYNKLWPVNEELIYSEGGLLVYSLNYSLDARTT